jgi:hypothetical protein
MRLFGLDDLERFPGFCLLEGSCIGKLLSQGVVKFRRSLGESDKGARRP